MNENILRMFSSSRSVLIAVSKNAKLDGLASGLALYLSCLGEGKNSYICSEADLLEAKNLVAADKISHVLQLGGNTLRVSFPYKEGAIDKVTYNITEDRFNLLVEPRTGFPPLEAKDIQYSYTGGAVDLIVTIDAPNLESLGNIYLENPEMFVREKIVNIDRRFDNKEYGAENIIDKQSSSTAEIVLRLLQGLRWNINSDVATNLYAGLVSSTNNFSSFSTNAQSFEAASQLLKNGARKLPTATLTKEAGSFPVSFLSQSPKPRLQPQPTVIQPQGQTIQPSTQSAQSQPPQDWLKPKIFKSTDII